MIILHATNLHNQLLLWGETPAVENALPKKQRKSGSNRSQDKLYPFDAGFAALANALQEG